MKLVHGETAARTVSERIAAAVADSAALQAIPADRRVAGMIAVKLDDGTPWQFNGTSSASAGSTVIVPDAGSGRWLALSSKAAPAGTDLTDAPATITVAQGSWRKMPAATLSATRAFTLGTTGAVAGDQIEITRLDTTANTMTVVNGGVGAGTLFTFPVSKIGSARFQFDGTNWALRTVGYQA